MKVFTLQETRAIQALAAELGIPALWLVALIDCESGWNPQIGNMVNPAGGPVLSWKPGKAVPSGYKVFAVGLNQIIPSTAQSLGIPGGAELVQSYPTVLSQLQGPTRAYLNRLKPFTSLQDLALSNFAPAYRKAPGTPLTGKAAQYNPQFRTYGDYANVVTARAKKLSARWKAQELASGHPVATGVGVVAFTGAAAWLAWKYL